MVVSAGVVRGETEVTVTATDGDGESISTTLTVMVAEGYTLTASPMRDADNPSLYLVEDLGPYSAKFNLGVGGSLDDVTVTITRAVPSGSTPTTTEWRISPDARITITDSDGLIAAGFKAEVDLEGSLTVKSTDAGSRAFEISGECIMPGGRADIVVEDKDLEEVAHGSILCKEPPPPVVPDPTVTGVEYSVASYDDRMYRDVTDGYIITDSAGVTHLANMMTNVTGLAGPG